VNLQSLGLALHTHATAAAGRELAAELSASTVGRAGPEALLAMAFAYRAFTLRRPGEYPATLRVPNRVSLLVWHQ